MICPKCGKDAGEAKFCPECGQPLFAADTENYSNEPAKKKALIEEVQHAGIEETGEKEVNEIIISESEQGIHPLKKSKKKLYAIVAVVAVVAAAVIAVLIFQSRTIDVEKEIFNSYWVENNGNCTLSFDTATVLFTDSKNETVSLVWEIEDNNKIELSYNSFFSSFRFMTLEMVRHHGEIALKLKTDERDVYFFKAEKPKQSTEEITT